MSVLVALEKALMDGVSPTLSLYLDEKVAVKSLGLKALAPQRQETVFSEHFISK